MKAALLYYDLDEGCNARKCDVDDDNDEEERERLLQLLEDVMRKVKLLQ
jgi:hypothetical protein